MKVKVSIEISISDDLHPDAAGAIIDMALCAYKSADVRNWHMTEIKEIVCTSDDPNNHQGDTCPIHEA